MTDSLGKPENPATRNSVLRSLRGRIISKQGLFLLVIVLVIAASFALYSANIDWVEAIRTYGFIGVFLLMLFFNMTILFPLPGEAVIAAAPGLMNLEGVDLFWLGLVASAGATVGEITGYLAGRFGEMVIKDKYQESYARVERWMERRGGPAIFVFALIPFPFDIVGIVAGSLRFPLWKFLIYCWAGRLIKYLLVVYLGWRSFSLLFS